AAAADHGDAAVPDAGSGLLAADPVAADRVPVPGRHVRPASGSQDGALAAGLAAVRGAAARPLVAGLARPDRHPLDHRRLCPAYAGLFRQQVRPRADTAPQITMPNRCIGPEDAEEAS